MFSGQDLRKRAGKLADPCLQAALSKAWLRGGRRVSVVCFLPFAISFSESKRVLEITPQRGIDLFA